MNKYHEQSDAWNEKDEDNYDDSYDDPPEKELECPKCGYETLTLSKVECSYCGFNWYKAPIGCFV